MKKNILAVLFCLFLCISSFAQNQRVSMTGGKMTYAQVFSEIETQTGMSVDYDAHGIDLSKAVSVPAGTTTVGALLDSVLAPAGYTYTVNRSHFILKEIPKVAPPHHTERNGGRHQRRTHLRSGCRGEGDYERHCYRD